MKGCFVCMIQDTVYTLEENELKQIRDLCISELINRGIKEKNVELESKVSSYESEK